MKHKQPKTISIIGAGIMGLACAFTFEKKLPETKVKLYDCSGFPALESASYLAGGMIAPYSELDHMPLEFLPAAIESLEFWKNIAQSCGRDIEYNANGSLIIAHPEDSHLLQRFSQMLPTPDDVWSKNLASDLEPMLGHRFSEGIFLKNEAHLHPKKAMDVMSHLIKNKEKNTIDIDQEALKSDWVIDCRGINAQSHERNLRGVKGEILVVENKEFKLSRTLRLMHPRYPLYIVPRANNIFMIGATIIESAENQQVLLRSGLELMSALYSLHPSFAESKILNLQAGIRPAFPDNLPHIYHRGNIISCNGLFRHGYLLSPAMAGCVSDFITGDENIFSSLFFRKTTNEIAA